MRMEQENDMQKALEQRINHWLVATKIQTIKSVNGSIIAQMLGPLHGGDLLK